MSDKSGPDPTGRGPDTAEIETAIMAYVEAYVEAVSVAAAEAAHLAVRAGMVGDTIREKAVAAAAGATPPTVAGKAGAAARAFVRNAGEHTLRAAAHAAADTAGRRLDPVSVQDAAKAAARTVAERYLPDVIGIAGVPAGRIFEASAPGTPNRPIPPEREAMSEHTHPNPARDDLWRAVLEKQAHEGEIDTDAVVDRYRAVIHDRPILRLVQDINERVAIYGNLLEDVKRQSMDQPGPGRPTVAQELKFKYEGLGLVPRGQLPNPLPEETARYALKKIRQYTTSLLQIMAKYTKEIIRELNVTVDVKVNLNVDMKLPWPGMTIGVESGGDA